MSASPRLRWLCQTVTDLLGVGSPNEVEALLRDPDAAAIVSAFFRGQLDAVVFFYQPKEVLYDIKFPHVYLFGHINVLRWLHGTVCRLACFGFVCSVFIATFA